MSHNPCSCGVCASCVASSCENGPVSTVKAGSYSRVSDRNGNPANLKPLENSGVQAITPNGTMPVDGSKANPLFLKLQELLQAGGVVVVTSDGLVGQIIPTGEIDLHFGLFGGALGFKDVSADPLSMDATQLSETSTGFIAALECADGNKLQLAKFKFNCGEGIHFLTVEDGIVSCHSKTIDECFDGDAVDEADAIYTCTDGVWTKLLPVAGKTLIGSTASPSKWTLQDTVSNFVPTARTSIYSKSHVVADAGALASDNINITTLTGYNAAYKYALLHFRYTAATSTSDFKHDVAVDGRNFVGAYCLAGAFQGSIDSNTALVEIPITKSWNVTNTRTFWQPGSANGAHNIDIYLDAWIK